MAGYWQSSFFEMKLRSINIQKKELGQYPDILAEQAWSMKDLVYGFNNGGNNNKFAVK